MFLRGTMKEDGVDITIRNNPDHFLAPNDWDMVTGVKFNKVPKQEYKTWYLNLLKERWEERKEEFVELAKTAVSKDIKLKCFCAKSSPICHAGIATDFMNILVKKLQAL